MQLKPSKHSFLTNQIIYPLPAQFVQHYPAIKLIQMKRALNTINLEFSGRRRWKNHLSYPLVITANNYNGEWVPLIRQESRSISADNGPIEAARFPHFQLQVGAACDGVDDGELITTRSTGWSSLESQSSIAVVRFLFKQKMNRLKAWPTPPMWLQHHDCASEACNVNTLVLQVNRIFNPIPSLVLRMWKIEKKSQHNRHICRVASVITITADGFSYFNSKEQNLIDGDGETNM